MSWLLRSRKMAVLAVLLCAGSSALRADSGLALHKKLYAVPAPGKVTADGKLGDWDLSGQITTYVQSETSEQQSAKFALMYDKNNIYLSAVIRDATPMMNRHDPAADGAKGWDADACQFRLALDPKLDYPLTAATYGGQGIENLDITHLILWYFTDKGKPALQMHKSMRYQVPRPEWAPFGVVPENLYQAKYVMADEKRGYTFEYVIPWSTLGAKAPLKAGDMVAGTVQFNYSEPKGLKTAGGSAWCYDVMNGPGFTFQNTGCWGKLLFSEKGHLQRELVEEGVPPARPLPLKFKYDLPEDTQITIQIMDNDNVVRRILVAQGDRRAGTNIELWDGMDSNGKPLLPGTYTWKGIYHKPITQKYLFAPHNSGQPTYVTDDGTGGWGGDHGTPQAVVAFDDGLLMSWDSAEAGSGIIRTDLTGRKKWGNLHCATYMATDGKRVFTAGDLGFDRADGVHVLDVSDGKPMSFTNGQSDMPPPPGGEAGKNNVTGLAYANNTVYASYGDRDLIAAYDAQSAAPKGTWSVPGPGRLGAMADGTILAVSQGKVVALKDGAVKPFAADHLDDPRGIAVAPDGTVYVANAGKLQNVSVFDAAGHYQRSIGKAGGRPAVGRYDSSGMLEPGGITLDKNGRLWVAEQLDSPKRVSSWDAKTGAFVNEYFGASGYFGYSYIDPKKNDEIYCHNVLWKIDWARNTCAPYSTIWRNTTPNMMWPQGPHGYSQHPVFFTARNGHQYAYGGNSFMSVLSYRDGDIYKPFAASISLNRGYVYFGDKVQFPIMADEKKYPNGSYMWFDANDDQTIQENELQPVTKEIGGGPGSIDENGDIGMGGTLLKAVRFEANGRPIYDLAAPRENDAWTKAHVKDPTLQLAWADTDGNFYSRGSTIARYTADGQRQWAIPGMVEWHQALALPIQAPGRLYGLTNSLGVAGEFTGNSCYFGTFHIWNRDGVYVGMLMRDARGGGGLGPDVTASETLTGQLVKPEGMNNRYFLLGGAADARVTEIFGLDTVKPLPGGQLTLTEADMKLAVDALTEYNGKIARGKRLAIARERKGLATTEAVSRIGDAGRSFRVKAAYDAANLYLQYQVSSDADLMNTQPDPNVLFKGGNCLDITIATDPAADAKRKTPAPGDVRLLVTRKDGKPFAVIYRPKVKGFNGTPVVLSSPTGKEAFDVIEVSDRIGLEYAKTGDGYTALVTIPQEAIGLALKPGMQVKMDVGIIYGNTTGNKVSARNYWVNNSFSANVTNDVPNEARLEPAEWGTAVVE